MRRIPFVRRLWQVPVAFLALATVGACELEQSVATNLGPTAGVRFINAVPDTQALDFRFVDEVENSAFWGVGYRNNPVTSACVTGSSLIQFKPAEAGERHFKIFLSDTLQAAAQQVMQDATVTLEPSSLYTVLLWGYSRPGASPAMRMDFMEETPPDPGAQVAIRVLNATPNAIDVRHYVPSTTSNAVPLTATWGNVAPLTLSSYVMVDPSQLRFNVQPAGGTTLLVDGLALVGAAATPGFDPIPGTTIAGTAITAIIFPLHVSGSEASSTTPFRPNTGSVNTLSATATGYARSGGNFLNECFFVGGTVTASGFVNAQNNGTSVITAVTATALTVSKAGGTVAEPRDNDGDPNTPFPNRSITGATPTALLSFMWDRRPPRP